MEEEEEEEGERQQARRRVGEEMREGVVGVTDCVFSCLFPVFFLLCVCFCPFSFFLL